MTSPPGAPYPLALFLLAPALLLACGSDEPQCGNTLAPSTTAYSFNDTVAPSAQPPRGLQPSQVPQFVGISWDDNSRVDGMEWALELAAARKNPDGTPVKMTFFMTTKFIAWDAITDPRTLKKVWREALAAGHEVAVHGVTQETSKNTDAKRWTEELTGAIAALTKDYDANEERWDTSLKSGPGLPKEQLVGWRTPLLATNDVLMPVLKAHGVWYDASLEEGFQDDQDGTNFLWPYTLDKGSPGDAFLAARGSQDSKAPITRHAGLWELPVYTVITPPEIRATLKYRVNWFDEQNGKISGSDFNLLTHALFQMNKAEFLATLKHTLDLRLRGNRAPFLITLHSDYYSPEFTYAPRITHAERRAAIEEFLDYALSKPEVRVRSHKEIFDWMRSPAAMECH
jgi:peptidoglycan/xylan/chitin deacetylase (PgdA/CDA1 family)